jgi:hypothetical protein
MQLMEHNGKSDVADHSITQQVLKISQRINNL